MPVEPPVPRYSLLYADLLDPPTVISGDRFFPTRWPQIASLIWALVTPDRSRAAASKLRVYSRFHPGLFLPRGKSWYKAARGSCCSSSFARLPRGIRTSIGSPPLAGRDR